MKDRTTKAYCNACGDFIESLTRHDFRWCKCKRSFVDGGEDYGRYGGAAIPVEVGYRVRDMCRSPGQPWSSMRHARRRTDGWFVPPRQCGPLAVFKDPQAARDFARAHTPSCKYMIDRVLYVRSRIQDMQWIPIPSEVCPEKYRQLPDGTPCAVILEDRMPEGKVLADAFYILDSEALC